MRVQIVGFGAMLPGVSKRLLPESNAQVAEETDLRSGEIRAWNEPVVIQDMNGPIGSIYRWVVDDETYWLQFNGDVDVVRGPVADDVYKRIYWTGDKNHSEPRMSYTPAVYDGADPLDPQYPVTSYKLGVPAPETPVELSADEPLEYEVDAVHLERPIRIEYLFDPATEKMFEVGDRILFSNFEDELYPSFSENNTYTEGDRVIRRQTIWEATEDINDPDEFNQNQWKPVSSMADFLNENEFEIASSEEENGNGVITLAMTDAENIDYAPVRRHGIDELLGQVKQWFGPDRFDTRFYVHTYVTNLGEEGPPSPTSEAQNVVPEQTVYLTLPALDVSAGEGRIIEKRRVYRTATGTRGAQFQFLAELDITETDYTDDADISDLEESLETTEWDPPPEGIIGLRVSSSGFLAGFKGNELWLSEPNHPHAWPTSYRVVVDYDIVGIDVVDRGVVVATEGRPYLVQGVEPRSMLPRKMPVNQACVSKRSVVSLGYAVLYASDEGLVIVSNEGASLITKGIIDGDEWQAYHPYSIHAYELEGKYIGFYSDGGTEKGGFVFDPKRPQAGIVNVDFAAVAGHRDHLSRTLFLLDENERIIGWDSGSAKRPYRWRSREFVSAKPVNIGYAKVAARTYSNITFRVFAGGELRYETQVTSENPFVLPAQYMERDFTLEVEGIDDVYAIEAAESMRELTP